MTTSTNTKIRFCENNFAELTSGQITFSSELAAFPFTNVINKFRSKVWKPSGLFVIDSTNNKVYINDGSDKTITLTSGNYTTPALLASHIQTQLNANSTLWSVTYSTTTYKFTISRGSSGVLRLSQTTNTAWDTIGFKTVLDLTGTSFPANEQRNHSYEFATFDFGYNAMVDFFALISPLGDIFPVSSTGTIKIQANNINDWTTPPLDISLTRTDFGIYRFFDDVSDTGYRYWRLYIVDKLNPLGPEGLSFGHIYLGDYVTLTLTNIANGFSRQNVDPSIKSQSESGALYFDKKTKFTQISAAAINLLNKDDREKLEKMFLKLGITTPFYCSIDPRLEVSNNLYEFTKYMVFENPPQFNHVFKEYFNMGFALTELL